MQPTNEQLPPGYTPLEEAIKIIQSDTRKDPVVDMDELVRKTVWIETNHGFRIPRLRRLKKEEIYRTKRGQLKEFASNGSINVLIRTNFDKELLKKTIYDKYRELVGHDYKEAGVRAMSTVADDAQGTEAVRPRPNKPIAKEGANIGGGETITSNGDGLQV